MKLVNGCLFCALISFVALGLTVPSASAQAQKATATEQSLLPGSKPSDDPKEWKEIVGIYTHGNDSVLVLERNARLLWSTAGEASTSKNVEIPIVGEPTGRFALPRSGLPDIPLSFQKEGNELISGVMVGDTLYRRADAGADPAHFYHITPSKPVAQLRTAALKAKPPAEAGPFRKADLVELAPLDPAIHLDIRYAQSNNFLSTPLYTQARAFLQRPAAEALLRALKKLQPLGYGLLIHDAYRPWYVTEIFWEATPPNKRMFVADPQKGSRHNRGCAVDLTLYDLATGKPIEMPGLYDEMSPRSFPNFPGGTSLQRWHRDLLRRAMESEGFTVDENEWWHYDYKDWKSYPILNVPFEDLQAGAASQ